MRSGTFRYWQTLALIAVACLLDIGGAARDSRVPSQTLELKEWFGVDHAEQIVEFPLDQPGTPGAGTVLNDSGTPVPFQLLEHGGKLAVRADLPAHTTRHWRWFSTEQDQTPPTPGVRIQQRDE